MKLTCALAAILFLLSFSSAAPAVEIKTAGSLRIPVGTPVVAICTDPVVQSVLNQDLSAHRRELGNSSASPLTITVTLTQHVLAPGTALKDLAPGDPAAVALLKDVGAEPPPLGDTGNRPIDPYAELKQREAMRPDDPITSQFRNYQAFKNNLTSANAASAANEAADSEVYDTAIIARAALGGAPDELKLVALAHPGDDLHSVKTLIAEEIANAILH